jgi:cyclohexa-1,5-dienecarbonyl-CoA hydratase
MLTTTSLYDGQVEHLLLANGKGNILNAALLGALRDHLKTLGRPQLKLLVFEGAGKHFSFGASVEEHLPGQVESMLPGFHNLFRELEDVGVPTLAVVRGACLGGGFELATWCGRVFVSPSANLGVPEITLGVFPPIAAMGLRWRTGGNVASELVLTGRSVPAQEAVAIGLAEACVEDPAAAWRAWFEAHLSPRSAPAVRFAWKASRAPVRRALREELPELERLYLEELMACQDPVEGLTAFIERRKPDWSHA